MKPISRKLAILAGVSIAVAAKPAQAAIFIYTGVLSGAAESPPNGSAGTGTVTVTYDNVTHTMRVQSVFSGLTGTTTAAHIHAATLTPGTGTAGVATTVPSFIGFPLGVTSGSFDFTYDMTSPTSWNAAYISANGGSTATAEAALFGAMGQGRTYFNIHTSAFGGGEIRGFLNAPVPEPATWALLIAGFGVMGAGLRRDGRRAARIHLAAA